MMERGKVAGFVHPKPLSDIEIGRAFKRVNCGLLDYIVQEWQNVSHSDVLDMI